MDWKAVDIVAYTDGGSRTHDNISASAWLIKSFSKSQPVPRIIAAGARFHSRAAKHSLAIEVEAM
eukprot:8419214-Karenia_brevis.AAC.1